MGPIIALLLLRGEGGLIKAASFAGGAVIVRLLQGSFIGYLFVSAEDAGGDAGPDLIASTVLLVVGIFLVIAAASKAWRIGDDAEAPPPKWLTALRQVSAIAAFGMGVGMMTFGMKQWIFTLSALAIIEKGQLGMKGTVFAYLFFVLAAQSLMLTPIMSRAVAPIRSAKTLETLQGWLERHNRKIAAVASLIFGTWFIWKGASGLLGLSGVSHHA
jgi:hypothetical protein